MAWLANVRMPVAWCSWSTDSFWLREVKSSNFRHSLAKKVSVKDGRYFVSYRLVMVIISMTYLLTSDKYTKSLAEGKNRIFKNIHQDFFTSWQFNCPSTLHTRRGYHSDFTSPYSEGQCTKINLTTPLKIPSWKCTTKTKKQYTKEAEQNITTELASLRNSIKIILK